MVWVFMFVCFLKLNSGILFKQLITAVKHSFLFVNNKFEKHKQL